MEPYKMLDIILLNPKAINLIIDLMLCSFRRIFIHQGIDGTSVNSDCVKVAK